eukprot:4161721-Prymnesium_polylepis.1
MTLDVVTLDANGAAKRKLLARRRKGELVVNENRRLWRPQRVRVRSACAGAARAQHDTLAPRRLADRERQPPM